MTAHAFQNIPAEIDAGHHTASNAQVVDFPVKYRKRCDEIEAKPARGKRTRKPQKPKERKFQLKDIIESHPNLNANAKLVGGVICGLFDLDEECAFPSNAWFKQKLGINPSTVRRALMQLEAEDVMHREINAAACGQNKIRPNWSKLPNQTGPGSKDNAEAESQSQVSAPGGQGRLPEAVRDGAPGQSGLTAVGKAEPKLEDQHEEQLGEDKTRSDAGAPALTSRPADASLLDGDQAPKDTPVPKRMSFNDEYDILVSRFPGNPMGTTYRGDFCGIRTRGFTLDDVLVALEYDTTIANRHGEPRCMASFLEAHFADQVAPGDVQHWKDRLAEHKREIAAASVRSRPKASVPRAVLEMAAERRAQEAARARAFDASARARVEALDADDEDDREDRRLARRSPSKVAEDHAPF